MTQHGRNFELKQRKDVQDRIKELCKLDRETGEIQFNTYAYFSLSLLIPGVGAGKNISMPYSHLVWFLEHGKWPDEGMEVDHIDENPLNNRPSNLRLLTRIKNNERRKGKPTKKYGTGKYGHGVGISYSRTENRYTVYRTISGEIQSTGNRKIFLAKARTKEEAEDKARKYAFDLENYDFVEDINRMCEDA